MAGRPKVDSSKLQDLIDRIDAKKLEIEQAGVASGEANKRFDRLIGELMTLKEQFASIVNGYL